MRKSALIFFYSLTAYAAPEGFELVLGQASAPQVDSQGHIHIQSTEDSVVHWDRFSLGPEETLIFDQPQVTSRILNRVVGTEVSEILGKLQSNGIVYLINSNGILIGPQGTIQAAGFLASTLDTQGSSMKNALEFFSKNSGSIVNLGTISCPVGQITLLAQNIDNQGQLNGSVQAITCTKATLQIDNQRVFIQPEKTLDNLEDLQDLHNLTQKNPYAHAIKHSGRITSNVFGTQDGKVYIYAQKGRVDITGNIQAADVQLLGEEVVLREKAIIDASKDPQGGGILIGGGYKGQDITIPSSNRVFIDTDVQLRADALKEGDGGKIIIWSEESTEYLGSLSARGGLLSGNGGFAEISGVKNLQFDGVVDLTANKGATGQLLIDPDNIVISPGGTDSAMGQIFNTPGSVIISGSAISTALNAANLTLQANQGIFVEDNITGSNGNTLTLQAGISINIFNNGLPLELSLNGGSFLATFNSNGPLPPTQNSATFSASNLSINTGGGDIIIQQGGLSNYFQGKMRLDSCLFRADTGSVQLLINPNNQAILNSPSIEVGDTGITASVVTLNGTGVRKGVELIGSEINGTQVTINGASNEAGIILVNSDIRSVKNPQIPIENSIMLHSSIGSLEVANTRVVVTEEGALTVRSQADCILSQNSSFDSNVANFSVGRDLLLANATVGSKNSYIETGSLQFDVEGNVSLQAPALIGYGDASTTSNVKGDIIFTRVGGDLTIQGSSDATPGIAQIGHISRGSGSNTLNGDISLLIDGSVSVIGGSSSKTSYAQIGHGGGTTPFTSAGNVTIIAGENLIMQSNEAPANIINRGGNITLVVDNLFPKEPSLGNGFFSIKSNLIASEQLRIYTAVRDQNQINAQINGSPFIPGPLFVNTNKEMWATYYPEGSYGGEHFTIYYKDGVLEEIENTFQFAVDNAEIFRYLPIVNMPIYQAKLQYFSLANLMSFDSYRRVLRYRVDQKNLIK